MEHACVTKTAKIFMNGRSQAVRLPKEFRFDCDEVYVERQGDRVILTAKKPTWDEFFESTSVFGDDFLADRDDLPPQDRDFS
jgi:antitoxin VapB